jgi:hypothetical protein
MPRKSQAAKETEALMRSLRAKHDQPTPNPPPPPPNRRSTVNNLTYWIEAHCRRPGEGYVYLNRAERQAIRAIVASEEIQTVGGELAAFLVLANICALGPEIDADVTPDMVWAAASTDLRATLRFDGVIIAHPLMGRRFPE